MRDRYWHNMAGRIQRAYRNYLRYKNECAKRIQRFWKNNKEGIAYAQIRDYGHQILAGRKERRRFSLISYRRFMGDYLDINGKSALGEELGQICGIGCEFIAPLPETASNNHLAEKVVFSGRGELLVSKFGRSSKPSPRFIILVCNGLCRPSILLTTSYRLPRHSISSSLPQKKVLFWSAKSTFPSSDLYLCPLSAMIGW